ncbi:hypothetical protein P40_19980 [Alloalcanivorax xenomutans]|nr:hypothetical protein P40_19980 [Alloalcanivorax xenomutans]
MYKHTMIPISAAFRPVATLLAGLLMAWVLLSPAPAMASHHGGDHPCASGEMREHHPCPHHAGDAEGCTCLQACQGGALTTEASSVRAPQRPASDRLASPGQRFAGFPTPPWRPPSI